MSATKTLLAIVSGAVITVALLLLMNSLINTEFKAPEDGSEFKIPDIRMGNTKVETRFEEAKPEKPEEPQAPPELPEPVFDTPQVSTDAIVMTAPKQAAGLDTSGHSLNFSEGEYLPIVKVPPEYPSNALSRGIEGYCTVVYTVTETGTVRDAQAIPDQCVTKDGRPTTVFNRASERAALKFKYKPKVVDGQPVEVPGVRNRFTYEMAK